jgi:hypothetical protein
MDSGLAAGASPRNDEGEGEKPLRLKSNFTCAFNAILVVQISREKYSALR